MSDSQDKSVRSSRAIKSGEQTIELEGKKLSSEQYVWQCVNDGLYPDRTYLSFSDRLRYAYWRTYRLHLARDEREEEAIVRLVGKSAKQLSRYFEGAEPPFSVVHRLAIASQIPIGWISGDDFSVKSNKQWIETTNGFEARFPRPLLDDSDQWVGQVLAEADARLLAGSPPFPLDHLANAIDANEITQERDLSNSMHDGFDTELLGRLAGMVRRAYDENGHKITSENIAIEAGTLYNLLAKKVGDLTDGAEIEATLPQIEYLLKKRLKEASLNPGTGKLSA